MSKPTQDTETEHADIAGVAFDPFHLLTLTMILGSLAGRIVPFDFLPGKISMLLGPIVTVASFGLFFWSGSTMRRADTAVPTNQPTTAIVEEGPFRFSRNPTYVAILLLQVGVGIWANSLVFFGLAVLSAILLSWGVISREEKYLEQKFGHEYVSYKARVRQWL